MKSLTYKLQNNESIKLLLDFCGAEEIQAVPFDADDDIKCHMLLISDDYRLIQKNMTVIPSCYVSSQEKQGFKCLLLNENFSSSGLRMLLDHVFHGSLLWNMSDGITIDQSNFRYTTDNDLSRVDSYVGMMTRHLMCRWNFNEVEKIRMGAVEMLTNAIEHGNLGITSEEKFESTENGTYQELINKRLNNKKFVSRKVFINVRTTKYLIEISIEDEGEGFDTNRLPSPNKPEELLKLHGRGILIAKAYFDKVEYNQKGNKVTLVKNFNRF